MKKHSSSVNDLADCTMQNKQLEAQLKALGFNPNGERMTFQEAMICSMIASAIKGDQKAAREVMKYYVPNENTGSPLEQFLADNSIEEVVNNEPK